jgi:hypothetical protein
MHTIGDLDHRAIEPDTRVLLLGEGLVTVLAILVGIPSLPRNEKVLARALPNTLCDRSNLLLSTLDLRPMDTI